jgi:hypothetical protein
MSRVLGAHTCNSSYSGESRFEASLGKLFAKPYLQNRAGRMAPVLPKKKKKKKERNKYIGM